jgi:hypothetical protein
LRQLRKNLRQPELGLRSPQSERARQALALDHGGLACAGELRRALRVERLVARELQPAPVADLRHALREFGAGRSSVLCLLEVLRRLPRGDGAVVSSARLGRAREDCSRCLQQT